MVTENPDPEERGEWEPVEHRFGHLPVHVALLHTGEMLAFGGSANDETRLRNPSPAELFDPVIGVWTTLASMAVDRLYHSNALLLPDGRVMTTGSSPERRVDERRIETYRPPYLFRDPGRRSRRCPRRRVTVGRSTCGRRTHRRWTRWSSSGSPRRPTVSTRTSGSPNPGYSTGRGSR